MGRAFSQCSRWLLTLGASLGLAQRAAGAEPELPTLEPPTSFRWSFVRLAGAESCPGAEKIATGVRSRLGRDPFANDADNNIEGTVTRQGDVWRAHLSIVGPNGVVLGSRELQSSEPDCTTLADAITLAVALVIDPRAAFASSSREPALPAAAQPPAPPPAAVESPSPPPPAPPLASPRPAPPPEAPTPAGAPLAVSLRGALALGLLPRTAFGIESAGAARVAGRWSLSVGISYFPEVPTSDRGFAFGLSAGFVGLCFGVAQSRAARLAVCADGQLGAMHAVVYAARPLPPGDHLWAGARAGPRLRLLLGGALWLEGSGMALAPLLRHEFALKNQQDPVFQSSPLAFTATLGLSAAIP